MTKKEAGLRGVPCSWETCREPAVWKILDSHGTLVRYWCETHHQNLWKMHSHPGMSSVLIGGVARGSEKEIPPAGTGSRGNPDTNDTPASATRSGDRGRRSTRAASAGGYDRDSAPSPGRALTTTPRAGDDPPATPALLPPSTPSLAWWQGAGELQLTPEQQAMLWQPVDEAEVLIRPDGIVYLPWTVVWFTLLRAFSPYVPSILPLAKPAMQDGVMCAHIVMTVNRTYIGDAVGECRYQPMNRQMSWASAAEGAVSDAIVKISKRLGMFQELWSVPWINQWKATHAIRVYRSKQQRWDWRRIDDEPFPDEGRPGRSSPGEGVNAQRLEDEVGEHFDSLGSEVRGPRSADSGLRTARDSGLLREPGQEG